jgi:uncharacterized protein YlxP (DUF503 family)
VNNIVSPAILLISDLPTCRVTSKWPITEAEQHTNTIIIIIIIIIIIRDNKKRTCILTDVAIPGDRNVIKKEADKILKYKDLTTEIERMWNVQTRVIPVIIGATWTISKSFRKYVSYIQGNHDVKELHKIAILGTAHVSESANVKEQKSQRKK